MVRTTTPEAAEFARVVAANAHLLTAAGFKKRRGCFNRRTADGLVHVAFYWMAPKEPPAWTEVPGLRERLYGKFRPEFGVHVPEMTRMGVPKSDWINAYNCHLRQTIGGLIGSKGDLWWSLADERAPELARMALEAYGLPWLDKFPDRQAVVDQFHAFGPIAIGMGPAGGLDVADMLTKLGRRDEARGVLERYIDKPISPPHAGYLGRYLPSIGFQDLVPRIRVE